MEWNMFGRPGIGHIFRHPPHTHQKLLDLSVHVDLHINFDLNYGSNVTVTRNTIHVSFVSDEPCVSVVQTAATGQVPSV